MSIEDRRSQTFAERMFTLLDERFPWLGKENDEPVSEADTVDALATMHRALVDQRNANRTTGKT
jgi:hypothetical protein